MLRALAQPSRLASPRATFSPAPSVPAPASPAPGPSLLPSRSPVRIPAAARLPVSAPPRGSPPVKTARCRSAWWSRTAARRRGAQASTGTRRRRRRPPARSRPPRSGASPATAGGAPGTAAAARARAAPPRARDRRSRPVRAPARPRAAARRYPGAARAPGGTRRTSPGAPRRRRAPRRQARRRSAPTSVLARRDRSWQEPLELLLQVHPRPVQPCPHRAELQVERGGDLLVRQALEITQHDHHAALVAELGDRPMQRGIPLAPLELVGGACVAGRNPRQCLLTLAQEPPLAGRQAVHA